MFLDIGFSVLLLLGLLRGYRRGFVGQIVYISGIILAVLFAGALADFATPRVEPYLAKVPVSVRPSVVHLGSMAVILLATWLGAGLVLSRIRNSLAGSTESSGQDRWLGAILGLAFAGVIVSVIVAGLENLPDQIRKSELVDGQVKQSRGVAYARKTNVADWILTAPEVKKALEHARTVADYFQSDKGVKDKLDSLEQKLDQELRRVDDSLTLP